MMGEVIRVSGRAPDVGDLLREAMVSQRFADVALCCSGGQRFLAHRLVLSAASPYLQEVLLAHGKAAGYCEPITVILAEVEGPELAAILGFVYTGSATIPRARLEAFTRAAETLHVRIPPLTVPSFGSRRSGVADDDCKLDNVKIEETKIDSRYLGCAQYPSYDKWFNSAGWPFDGCLQRGDWLVTEDDGISGSIHRSADTRHHQRRETRAQRSFVESSDCRIGEKMKSSRERQVLTAGPWLSNNLPIFDRSFVEPTIRGSRTSDDGSCDDDLRLRASTIPTIIHPADRESRLGTFPGADYSVSRMSVEPVSSCRDEAPRIRRAEGAARERDNNDFEGRLAESVPSLPPVHRTTGRSSVTFEKQDYDAGVVVAAAAAGAAVATLAAAGNVPTSASATVTSNIGTNTANLLICGESCCRWRTPRRHVANRVPASPWIQLARPAHHSPKIQPIVLRSREENGETSQLQWNEASSLRGNKRASPFSASAASSYIDHSSSLPLNLQLNNSTPSNDCPAGSLYGFQVPINATSQHLYEAASYKHAPLVFPVAPPIAATADHFPPRISATEVVRASKTSCFEDPPAGSRLQSADEGSNTGSPEDSQQGGVSQHAISPDAKKHSTNDPPTCNRQASPRVELSHPISRLCDSVSLNNDAAERVEGLIDKNPISITTPTTTLEAIKSKPEETRNFTSKIGFPLTERIVQSDNNNNEADATALQVSRNFTVPPGAGNEAKSASEGIGISEDHRCEQCGKTFVTRASLKVHGRTHSGEKPFRCSDCGKEFSQLRNYKYHRSVHEGTREFAATCPECGKYFNDRGYLSSHMKIHRNRKEYACAECGKSFNQRVAYNMHVRIHTGVKPHQCEQCGKAFSRKMLLKQHLRTHSGERPYQCQICHKAFADRSNMTLHTRLHSGLKPYQCTLCTKAFTKKHHLKTHLNYHTGTKPYSCPNCSLRFSQSSNMRTHYKKCSAASGGNPSDYPAAAAAAAQLRSEDSKAAALAAASSSVPVVVAEGDGKPRTVAGRTNALTPPSSDQESSLLTPLEKRCRSGRGYPAVRSKDIATSVPDT